jgi:hypothetical protein
MVEFCEPGNKTRVPIEGWGFLDHVSGPHILRAYSATPR